MWSVIALVAIAALMAAFGWWVHRLDRDDFDQGTGSTLTEGQRRVLQIGIGLGSSGSQIGGH